MMLVTKRTILGHHGRHLSAAWASMDNPVGRRMQSSSSNDGESVKLVKVEPIDLEIKGRDFVKVTMASPPVNSLNTKLVLELRDTIKSLEQRGVCGMILASDTNAFSAGLDLKEVYNVSEAHFLHFWANFEDLWRTLYLSPLATVAAIEKHAPAGGSVLALSCDYRVLDNDEKLRLGLNEAMLGMLPPRWLSAMCARTVGERNSEWILQNGEMMSPKRAMQIGFVDEIVGKEEVIPRATEILKLLGSVPPKARAQTKMQQRRHIAEMAGPSSGAELWESLTSDECMATVGRVLENLKNKRK